MTQAEKDFKKLKSENANLRSEIADYSQMVRKLREENATLAASLKQSVTRGMFVRNFVAALDNQLATMKALFGVPDLPPPTEPKS